MEPYILSMADLGDQTKKKEIKMTRNRSLTDRREFLQSGLLGLAGIGTAVTARRVYAEDQDVEKKRTFIRRTLGKTGIELPVVSMGVMNADNPGLVRAALDSGITLLDTAHGYQRGRNETMVGEVIKGRSRESFVIATKVEGGGLDRKTGRFTERTNPDAFLERFETSLGRLGLEYVDILHLHSVVSKEAALYEPITSVMESLKASGKTRHLGISTHRNEPEVIRAAAESKIYDVVLTAYNFRQPHVAEVESAIAYAAKAGLGIIAMKTQAGGYWDRERQRPINMKAALKWVLGNENVHTAVPGFTTFDQMELDLTVMEDLVLTPSERSDLELTESLGDMGIFCPQCGSCLTQCGKGVDIPTLMRAYMYAYGYRNLAAAKDAVLSAVDSELPCVGCSICTVKCASCFDVRRRLLNISRLSTVPFDFLV